MVFSFLCVYQLVSRQRMPPLSAPIDYTAWRVMKQPDHLTRALLFMSSKCLALFAELSGTVCLEPLINPAGVLQKKSVPLSVICSIFYFSISGVSVKIQNLSSLCPRILAPQLFGLHLPTASTTTGPQWA